MFNCPRVPYELKHKTLLIYCYISYYYKELICNCYILFMWIYCTKSLSVSIPLHKQNLMERMPHITWYEIIIPLVQWTVTGLCRGFQLSLKSCRLTCFGHTCICTRRAEWIWIHHKIGNKQLAVLVSCKHEQWAVAIRQMALTVVYKIPYRDATCTLHQS